MPSFAVFALFWLAQLVSAQDTITCECDLASTWSEHEDVQNAITTMGTSFTDELKAAGKTVADDYPTCTADETCLVPKVLTLESNGDPFKHGACAWSTVGDDEYMFRHCHLTALDAPMDDICKEDKCNNFNDIEKMLEADIAVLDDEIAEIEKEEADKKNNSGRTIKPFHVFTTAMTVIAVHLYAMAKL